MLNQTRQENADFNKDLQAIATRGFENAAKGLSKMIGKTLTVIDPKICSVELREIQQFVGGPENDAVGIYMWVEGDLSGQVMMVIPYARALEIADMLMEVPEGTTQSLGPIERSGLAEIGDLTCSFFLNTVAEMTGVSSWPTPPAVMVDMVGAILDVVIATMGAEVEPFMMFRTAYKYGGHGSEVDFWVIPDAVTIGRLAGSRKTP